MSRKIFSFSAAVMVIGLLDVLFFWIATGTGAESTTAWTVLLFYDLQAAVQTVLMLMLGEKWDSNRMVGIGVAGYSLTVVQVFCDLALLIFHASFRTALFLPLCLFLFYLVFMGLLVASFCNHDDGELH